MRDLYFDAEEEQEQAERASDERNFALCAAHVNAVYKTDFAEWFLRMLAFRRTRRARARWEEELPDRQKWRLKYYENALKYEHALRREIAKNSDFKTKAQKRADRERTKAFKVCAAHGLPAEDWSAANARRVVAMECREKLQRRAARQ